MRVLPQSYPQPAALHLLQMAAPDKKQASAKAGKKASAGSSYPLGQVSGVASVGDGTVWVFHRGDRAWQSDGSIGNASSHSASSDKEAAGLLAGPTVLQVGITPALHWLPRRVISLWLPTLSASIASTQPLTLGIPACTPHGVCSWTRTAARCCTPGAPAPLRCPT